MTGRRIQVCKFKLFGRWKDYWFYPDTGEIEPLSASDIMKLPSNGIERAMSTNGNIKRFIVGGTLVLFWDDSGNYIQVGKTRWKLGDPGLSLKLRRVGPIGVFTVQSKGFRKTFFYGRLLSAVSGVIDPTYDHTDLVTDDFPFHVISIHQSEISKT